MNEWMDRIQDVPIECPECNMLSTLGGMPDDTTDDLIADLCDCDAGFKIYVSDAPPEARRYLMTFLDLLQSIDEHDTLEVERETWADQARDDLTD